MIGRHMKRTLYLHIGSHRTATTSIQKFLLDNFDGMLAQGCLLPYRTGRHNALMGKIFSGRRDVDEVCADFNQIADDKDTDIHQLVVSDEDISMRRDLTPLKGFTDHFDVKIIFSIRRQDLWLESWYFQNIKWQWNPELCHLTFDEFLQKRSQFHWIHYNAYVTHLEEVFGRENILLSVFEKEQQPDGPVNAFCDFIGLGELAKTQSMPHVNASMSAAMVEFVRHLPLDEFEPPIREIFRSALSKVDEHKLGHTGKQSERLLPYTQREQILAEYAEGNVALAQRYFSRDTLFLQAPMAKDMPLARLEIPTDLDELTEKFLMPLMRELVDSGMIAPRSKKG
jgi:hypothetical protein